MILSVTLNPCIDHTLFVGGLKPHDTNKVMRIETDAGGKGINLSRMVAELGGESVATGFLGGDCGHIVHSTLVRQGVMSDFVDVHGETRTNFSVESGDGPPTTFNFPGIPVSGLEWENLMVRVAASAEKAQWVAFGGSMPPGVPKESYAILGALVKNAGARWALDADGEAMRLGIETGPDVVKPNRAEAERLLGTRIDSLRQAVAAAKDLHLLLASHGSPLAIAIISLGEKGAVMADARGALYAVPSQIQAKSTIGSGDSFLGACLLALSRGSDSMDALCLGTAAGAATALSDGTRIGSRDDTERLLKRVAVWDEQALECLSIQELDGWPVGRLSDEPRP